MAPNEVTLACIERDHVCGDVESKMKRGCWLRLERETDGMEEDGGWRMMGVKHDALNWMPWEGVRTAVGSLLSDTHGLHRGVLLVPYQLLYNPVSFLAHHVLQ